ncbi:MAG: thiamine pyrophosphate-requiring protein [Pseudomonadales bacterium]|nr:thiamine pyrophosphate-requiring protein [Pseudomonadales bacterium]
MTLPSGNRSVATNYLQALLDRGIDHVFANAGTDFAPIIEALVAARKAGRPTPEFITVPHENVAIAMAHGYFLATGKPAAVMVHVTVGTANALCGLMNAARDNAPILLTAGRTPSTETGHIGSRNGSIHWGQDSFDQGGLVREFVKWDYELRPGQPPEAIVGRALDIAMTEPRGPVYLCMPREVLGDITDQGVAPQRQRGLGALPATPSAAAIEEAAQMLANAEFPLIITASSGRDPANVERLSRLAGDFGIAVALPGEPGARDVNIPSRHPMFLGIHPEEAIARADVVLVIDCEVPWWPSMVKPPADAKLIHISPDPFFANYPVRGFEMDLAIAGSSSQALAMLLKAMAGASTARVAARKQVIAGLSAQRRAKLNALVASVANSAPIHPAWVAHCVNQAKSADTILVNEMGAPMDFLDLEKPRTYFSSSLAGGLGFGLGASIGARLGAPDQNVILIVGDGSYMFGCPTATHHAAKMRGLPTTTLVMNNARWNAVHRSTLGMYPDGLASREELMPLVSLGDSPQYHEIMIACGGHGEKVDDPAQLPAALQRALAANARGQAALLNVISQ